MSFNIVLLVSVVVLAFFMPLIGYFCFILGAETYRKGVDLGRNFDKTVKSEAIMPKFAKKPQKADPKIEKYNAIMRNLDTYDGTSIGQEAING